MILDDYPIIFILTRFKLIFFTKMTEYNERADKPVRNKLSMHM